MSAPTLTVRDAAPSDATAISTLAVHVFSLSFAYSCDPVEFKSYLDASLSAPAIAADIADPQKLTVVAAEGPDGAGPIAGFAMLTRGSGASEPSVAHLGDSAVELQRIYVAPDTHGKGVGRLLAQRLEAVAREERFTYMWLGVWEENQKAQTVYSKWGYKKVGGHDFRLGNVVQHDHIMLKTL